MTELEILRDIAAHFTKSHSLHSNAKMDKTEERNYCLVCDRTKGLSFTELSNKYNLSEGRCRQIIEKMKARYHEEFEKCA